MEKHIVKILKIEQVTHDVKRFIVERPAGYNFIPGQATEVAINKPGLENERRPFTFTGLTEWNFLEFTIKIYADHNGVTKKLDTLKPGDELIIHDVWGAINYKGPGVFIAGGAGVTPFIAIFRDLQLRNEARNNTLLFANKTSRDIILKQEFKKMLDKNFVNILSNESSNGYAHGLITEKFIKEHTNGHKIFYLCGPPQMMEAVEKQLLNMNVDKDSIVKEAF
jgi:ferredoxin-NADP reductase